LVSDPPTVSTSVPVESEERVESKSRSKPKSATNGELKL